MKIASFLVLAALTASVLSAEPDKTCDEKGGTCLDIGTLPNTTKPSEKKALLDLYESVGKPKAMLHWGEDDPCNGEKGGTFDEGFAYWQGIACRACSGPTEDFLCVRSIFLHQKDMNGTIPSTFVGFQDLEILLMSDNNVTGPLPTGMLSSCPKLRRVDFSYNKITGTLPLADMEGLVDLRQAFFDNNKFTTISEPPTPPFISGYENLMELNLNYNRDMNATFPIAIAYMPKLSYMKIHDTKLKGILPTNKRAFMGVEMLQISGSTICGDALPAVCDPANTVPGRFEGAFCDLPSLPACDGNIPLDDTYPTPPPIRLACPNRNYGIVTLEIYRQVLVSLGYEIEVITNLPHAEIYPKFLQSPRSSETVDILVTSDLPYNHDRFLVGHEDMFVLAGTSYEAEMITIVVPDSAPYTTLDGLSDAAPAFATKIIYTFDELACPVCKEDAEKWRDAYFTGFTVQAMSYTALEDLVKEHQDDSEFIAVSWIPHGFNVQYNLTSIDMQAEEAKYLNQGKALIRKDSIYKMGPAGVGVLSAIMVPTKDVEQMDFQVTQGFSPQEVAAAWIEQYADIVSMWSWN